MNNKRKYALLLSEQYIYEPFTKAEYFPEKIQKLIKKKGMLTLHDIESINLDLPTVNEYENSLKKMSLLSENQQSMVREIVKVSDLMNLMEMKSDKAESVSSP